MLEEVKKTIEEIRNIVMPYCIANKLSDRKLELEIKEQDYNIYDAWSPSPPSYSFILKENDSMFKISINTEDNEIIIEIKNHKNKQLSTFLKNINNECMKAGLYSNKNRVSTSHSDRGERFDFHGYFYNRKKYVYNILQQCLVFNS